MLKLINVEKEFPTGQTLQIAVRDVSLEIGPSEFVILSGRSGSGKTTLLNIVAGLEAPTKGRIVFEGQDLQKLNDTEISLIRRKKIGFIFQTFNLIPVLTAFENIEYPLVMLGVPVKERKERVSSILSKVGLEKFKDSKPGKLSGGQRQRVAIARALIKNPTLILADEPTANLDAQTAQEIIQLIQELFAQQKGSVIFCTHDTQMVKHGNHWIEMSDGRLSSDRRRT